MMIMRVMMLGGKNVFYVAIKICLFFLLHYTYYVEVCCVYKINVFCISNYFQENISALSDR